MQIIHMYFFKCPVLKTFWEEVEKTIMNIFELSEPLKPDYYLGINLQDTIKTTDIYLFNILCVTAMKQVTRTLKHLNSPKLTTEQIAHMEKLTYTIRADTDPKTSIPFILFSFFSLWSG